MGYRSDVAIALTKEANSKLYSEMSNIKNKELKEIVENLLKQGYKATSKNNGEVLYLFESTKWYYELYDETEYIHNTIRKLPLKQYLYIIMGEDLCDTHIYGDFYDNSFNLELNRSYTYSIKDEHVNNVRYT